MGIHRFARMSLSVPPEEHIPSPAAPSASATPVPIIPAPMPPAFTAEPEVVAIHAAAPSGSPGDIPRVQYKQPGLLAAYWRKMGASSLLVSLLVHAGLLIVGSFIVTSVVNQSVSIDFLPGGGSKASAEASEQLSKDMRVKKRNLLNKSTPMQKIVSSSTTSSISLPDIASDTIDIPEMSSLLGGGSMGSGGFGSSGAGGGFGDGMGMGGMSGKTFKPIIIFGNDLKARSIAVILDVSGSMTPHLTKVIKELDRVAKGSPVALYVGCGVAKPEKGRRLDDNAVPTRRQSHDEDKNFEVFWRRSHGPPPPPPGSPPPPPKKKGDPDPIPEEAVYNVMATRPSTYFLKSQGIQYAWLALLINEVRNAEALYWFSDFQDVVDQEQMESVLKNLKRRKQKLFIHASVKGASFEKVRDNLCLPSGGMVIESEPPKKAEAVKK